MFYFQISRTLQFVSGNPDSNPPRTPMYYNFFTEETIRPCLVLTLFCIGEVTTCQQREDLQVLHTLVFKRMQIPISHSNLTSGCVNTSDGQRTESSFVTDDCNSTLWGFQPISLIACKRSKMLLHVSWPEQSSGNTLPLSCGHCTGILSQNGLGAKSSVSPINVCIKLHHSIYRN